MYVSYFYFLISGFLKSYHLFHWFFLNSWQPFEHLNFLPAPLKVKEKKKKIEKCFKQLSHYLFADSFSTKCCLHRVVNWLGYTVL